jgi:hypothetical protein
MEGLAWVTGIPAAAFLDLGNYQNVTKPQKRSLLDQNPTLASFLR